MSSLVKIVYASKECEVSMFPSERKNERVWGVASNRIKYRADSCREKSGAT